MRIFGEHTASGLILGALFGVAYFLLDPVHKFQGSYSLIGAPLIGLFGDYLVFGLVLGILVGVFGWIVFAAGGRRMEPGWFVALYAALFAAFLTLMLRLARYGFAEIGDAFRSKELVIILGTLAAITACALALGRFLTGSRALGRLRPRNVVFVIVVAVAAAFAAQRMAAAAEYRLPERSGATETAPNIVMIVLDALRYDHMSAYGYDRDTTPNMARLAREGVIFRNAHSHGNRTPLAMPSAFASMYPSYTGTLGRVGAEKPLADERETIAEVLRDSGYTTVSVVSNIYLKQVFSMTQGFDSSEEFLRGKYSLGLYRLLRRVGIIADRNYFSKTPNATEVTEAALPWIDAIGDRPFFLYLHYMDSHHPYVPMPPYDTMFGNGVADPDPTALFDKTVALLVNEQPPLLLAPDELQKLRDYYDGRIRYADEEIGRIIEAIENLPDPRETIIVITADHGDEFLEHGSLYHNNVLIEELIRVPLIFWAPERFAPQPDVGALVRHIDILPTFADLAGAKVPEEAMGLSLVGLMSGESDDPDVTSISEGDFCTAINYRNWKMVWVDSTDTYSLYDLASEDGEYRDVSHEREDIAKQLRDELDAYVREAESVIHTGERKPLTPDMIRELKALGYL